MLFLEPGADPAAVAASLGYELKEVRDGFVVLETPEDRLAAGKPRTGMVALRIRQKESKSGRFLKTTNMNSKLSWLHIIILTMWLASRSCSTCSRDGTV